MRFNKYLLLLAAFIAAPLTRAADEQELPKAGTLMDRYIEVTGGTALYEKRQSEIATMEMEVVGRGVKGTITRYSDRSNNSYSTGQIEGIGKLEEGVYNGQAWEISAMMGPRLKEGIENADAVRDAMFNSALNWRKLYKAETVGLEKVDGEDCYKLTLTPLGQGKPQSMFLSKKTGLMTKISRTAVTAMGEIAVEVTATEYKPYDGILTPSKLVQSVMGNQIALTVQSIKTNEDIPTQRFEPPAEIKKMMAK